MTKRHKIAIIIPVLNEEQVILNNFKYLQELSSRCEVVFVDGQSTDNTVQLLKDNQYKVITSPIQGRGAQFSFGASNVSDDIELLLLLHIDTKLPLEFDSMMLQETDLDYWGRFNIELDSDKTVFKMIQWLMNIRSKTTDIATGDQAIYVTKNEFMNHLDKMIEHPLMEDIYLSKALNKSLGRGYQQKQPVITSVRYWEKNGIVTTIITMWKYRLLYFFGVSPNKLYEQYYK